MFFGSDVRRFGNLDDLKTLPTHRACNEAYREDEEYFAYSVAPLAMRSPTGKAVVDDIGRRFQAGRNQPLAAAVLREFEERPSGLILPEGMIVKRVDPERIDRVIWKITRGLFTLEYQKHLPESREHTANLFEPGVDIPEVYAPVLATESLGKFGAAFAYKHRVYRGQAARLSVWAMLFWGQVICCSAYHHLECHCAICVD